MWGIADWRLQTADWVASGMKFSFNVGSDFVERVFNPFS
jgi:hypothetical protein